MGNYSYLTQVSIFGEPVSIRLAGLVLSEELPLIERDHELGALNRFLDEASKGKGTTVAVTGEAGIGKTRLVREFAHQKIGHEARFIEARCNRDVGALPYGPWIQILQELMGTTVVAQRDKMETFIPPEFLRTVTNLQGTGQTIQGRSSASKVISVLFPSAEQEKLNLFETIRAALAKAAEQRALILLLDDLMWADDATIELLSYVSQGSYNQPILIISAYRDAEVDAESPLAKHVYQEKRDKRLKEIQLKALSKQGVAAIIESILGKERSSSEFTESIFAKTGGNPFFVEELTRSVAEQLRSTETMGPLKISDLQIPATVRTVIKQRLSKLTTTTFQSLIIGAMIGREFTFELLRDVTEISEDALLDQLEEALRARILRESKTGLIESFQFVDAPVHEYLVHEISLVRRRRYHKRIADLIEEKHSDLVRMQPEKLAYHYLHSGDNQKALKYTILGAENAQRFYAHEEARKLYQQALDLVEDDLKLEAELLERMAEISYFTRNVRFKDLLERAINAFRKLNLPRRVAALYDLYSSYAWSRGASADEARELCLQGLAELGDDTRNAEAAGLHAQIARIYVLGGRPSDAIQSAEKAAKIAEEAGASEVLAHVYQTLAISLPFHEKERIIKLLQDAIKISRDNELYDPLCRAHNNLGYVTALLKNDFEKAVEIYSEGLEEATRRGMLGYRLHLSSELAYYCYIPMGRYDQAKNIAEENLRLAGNWKFYQVYPRLILGHVSMAQGDYSKAHAYFEETLPLSRETGWSTLISDNLRELGTLALETNDLPAAEKWLNEANDYLQKIDDTTTVFRAEILFQLGRSTLLSNDLIHAKQLLEQIEQFSTMIQENWVLGFQTELAGYIAQRKGDADQANRNLNDALTIWEKTKREPDASRVRKALQTISSK